VRKVLTILLCISALLNMYTVKQVYAASSVTVDLSSVTGPVTHCATGSLYGVIENKPEMSLILPVKPNCLINPADSGYQQPWGAAIPVAQRFANTPIGTKVQIRLADWFSGWYSFTNMTDWFNKMTTTVNAVKSAGLTNIYGYEIWNEANGTWHNSNGITFNDFYSQSQAKLKSLDPTAKAIGPSWAGYDHNALSDFLTYQKNHNTLPDVMCWHDLFTPNLTSTIQDYRALEKNLGISPRPIVMNEYSQSSSGDEGVPGSVAPLIAKFERFQLENCEQSYWDVPHPGRLGSLLATDTDRNGGWWFYKWYGDMSGNMVTTTGANANDARAVDAFACVDSTKKYASVLFGGVTDSTASANVVVKNFPSFFGNKVHVRVDYTPYVDVATVVNSTIKKFEGDYTISNGQIIVPVTGMNNKDGYRMYITPYGQAMSRYEAEDAAVYHANYNSNSNASIGKYVGQIDYSDSYVDFYVNVPAAKTYTMKIRYANGTGANSTHQLSVNRGTASTVTYPATAGWGQFSSVNVNVNLNAGDNIIRLSKGSTGYAELDYIEIN